MEESDLARRIRAAKGDVVRFDRSALLKIWGALLNQEELVERVRRFCLKHGFEWRIDEVTKEFRLRSWIEPRVLCNEPEPNHPDQEVQQDHSLKHWAVSPSLDPYE